MSYRPLARDIIKTTKLYADGKTQVPSNVVKRLNLTPGESTIIWVEERGRIFIETSKIARESIES